MGLYRDDALFILCRINKQQTDRVRKKIISDTNMTRTHNHLVRKRAFNHFASLVKWLSVRLQTKWLWVRIMLLSLKIQIWLQARNSLTFRQTIECGFTLKVVLGMIIIYI